MNREEFEEFVQQSYGVEPDHPWASDPSNAVYRHASNYKWFALVMDVPRSRLGLKGNETVSIVNLKCDRDLIGSMRMNPGVLPAYHMSKATWVSVVLDGTAARETIEMLLDMSFTLTR